MRTSECRRDELTCKLKNKNVVISEKGVNSVLISYDIGIRSLKFIIIPLMPRNFNYRVRHTVVSTNLFPFTVHQGTRPEF